MTILFNLEELYMPFDYIRKNGNSATSVKGGRRQLVDYRLFSQKGGSYDELVDDVKKALTIRTQDPPGLGATPEDSNSIMELANNIVSKEFGSDEETEEQKAERLALLETMKSNMKDLITKSVDESRPISTESRISETNIALSRIRQQASNGLMEAMRKGNSEENTKLRSLMRVIQAITETMKVVRNIAEVRIQELSSGEDKCLITADQERLPGMYPITEFEDELANNGFIVKVDTGRDSDKNVCTFERLIVDPSIVRENLCRICLPVVMQTNSNHAYSLINNNYLANTLRLFLPEGKAAGDSLAIKIYGMELKEFVDKQEKGLIKTPPEDEEGGDAVVMIPHYVCAHDVGAWQAGDSLIVTSQVTFPESLWADQSVPAIGIVLKINPENETILLGPITMSQVTVDGPKEIAISEITPRFVKLEDFKDSNGKTYFMHKLKDPRIGQAATSDLYIRLRAFTEFGGIIKMEELYNYVILAAFLRKRPGSSFKNTLKLVAVPDTEQQPIASYKLTETNKVSKFIDDIIYGGPKMEKILDPIRLSKAYVTSEDGNDIIQLAKGVLIESTDKVIGKENASEPDWNKMPTLSKYLDTFNVVSASHCQDGQTETLYKIELSQEQQDEWDAWRQDSALLTSLINDIGDADKFLKSLVQQIKAAPDEETKTQLQQQHDELKAKRSNLMENKKSELKRLRDLRTALNKKYETNGGKKHKLARGSRPSFTQYDTYTKELTLPQADIYYIDMLNRALKELTNPPESDERYRSDAAVKYDPDIASLFCIPLKKPSSFKMELRSGQSFNEALRSMKETFRDAGLEENANKIADIIPVVTDLENGSYIQLQTLLLTIKDIDALFNELSKYPNETDILEEIIMRLEELKDINIKPDGGCIQFPIEDGPLRLLSAWLANQFSCDREYHFSDNETNIKAAIEALIHFKLIKKSDDPRTDLDEFDNDYVFEEKAMLSLYGAYSKPIGRFLDDEWDSISHDITDSYNQGESTKYIELLMQKNNVGFSSSIEQTEENCKQIVADPNNYRLLENDYSQTQPAWVHEVIDKCPILGEDVNSGLTLPAPFDDEVCTDLMCEVYRRYTDILVNTDTVDIEESIMTTMILDVMIEKGTRDEWVRVIKRDPAVADEAAAKDELKNMIKHIVECMISGEACQYDNVIQATCLNPENGEFMFNDAPLLNTRLFSADDGPENPNCHTVGTLWNGEINVPSNWTEGTCGDLMCAVKEEYEDIIRSPVQPSSLPEWVHQIIEIWSLLSEDPGARFLDLIKEAPEIANSDDPDSEARDKLGEMISNVVECLISDDDECDTRNQFGLICGNDSGSEDSFDRGAALVADNLHQPGDGDLLGTMSPINTQEDPDTLNSPTIDTLNSPSLESLGSLGSFDDSEWPQEPAPTTPTMDPSNIITPPHVLPQEQPVTPTAPVTPTGTPPVTPPVTPTVTPPVPPPIPESWTPNS